MYLQNQLFQSMKELYLKESEVSLKFLQEGRESLKKSSSAEAMQHGVFDNPSSSMQNFLLFSNISEFFSL